ncbi:WXG100 family type VII secretion target [Nonomuraea sp. SBT364]|uniref:WXG100 family type VII secretion target n=1 Tax=Nonomuraea sp. SBT364 TaxID=1580530 RepID=UPI00066C8E68|nr:WXG100 family type VII secretion target [Nonomuraea sp. SBT364]
MAAEDIFDRTLVNYEGLGRGETAFAKAHNDMVLVLEELETALLQKSAIWQGAAKTVFDEVRQLWNREANDMSQFVHLLKDNINITSMNMRDVDRINSQIFDGR